MMGVAAANDGLDLEVPRARFMTRTDLLQEAVEKAWYNNR